MEKNEKYFFVGVFVLSAFFALIFFTIWLSSPRSEEEFNRYTVYFTDPVDGLEEGAAVRYKGVEVGAVENIRFDKERVDLIKVDIAVEKRTPVRAHTRVELDTQGVTGFTHLELSTAPDDQGAPLDMPGEKYAVLTGSPSQFADIMNNVHKFSDEGLRDLTATSRELRATTKSAHQLVDQLRQDPSQLIWKKKKKP